MITGNSFNYWSTAEGENESIKSPVTSRLLRAHVTAADPVAKDATGMQELIAAVKMFDETFKKKYFENIFNKRNV